MQWKKKYPKTVKRVVTKKKGGPRPPEPKRLNSEFVRANAVCNDDFAAYCEGFGDKPVRTWVINGQIIESCVMNAKMDFEWPDAPDDEDKINVLVFNSCIFKSVSNLHILNTNVVFVECVSNSLQEISTDSHIGFVDCRFGKLDYVHSTGASGTTCIVNKNVRFPGKFAKSFTLGIHNFYRTIVKDVSDFNHHLGIYGCRNTLIENVQSYQSEIYDSDRRLTLYGEMDGGIHNITFKDCNITHVVYIYTSCYDVNLSMVNTKLSSIEAKDTNFHDFELDLNSSVKIMRAVNCYFHTFVDAEKINLFPVRCIGYGDCRQLTLYKKVYYYPFYLRPFVRWCAPPKFIIAQLFVPSWASRHFGGNKIRVSEAKVQAFFEANSLNGDPTPFHPGRFSTIRSHYDRKFKYALDAIVKPTNGYNDTDEVCDSGIHGFLDIMDAITY